MQPPQTNIAHELRWAAVFLGIFVVLTLLIGPLFKAHGVMGEISSALIGMLTAIVYVVARNASARRRRRQAEADRRTP